MMIGYDHGGYCPESLSTDSVSLLRMLSLLCYAGIAEINLHMGD